jgi:uncharacterized protein YmfQ (DUF2313 family)
MSAPYSTLTSADYLDAAQALLPSGPAWPRDTNTVFAKYMSAIANVAWLAHQMLADLFATELDPGATVNMLPDWEAAFGVTARGAPALRRTNLLLVIGDPGGFTPAHFVAVAAIAGVQIHTTDVLPTGTPFTWELHAPTATTPAVKKALQSVVATHNRATCIVNFVYDR